MNQERENMKTIKPMVKMLEKPNIKVGDEMKVNNKLTKVTAVSDDGFTVEELMQSLLPEYKTDLVDVKFTLTPKQYYMWEKVGGVGWVKKEINKLK